MLNGRKWFTTGADGAAFCIVMAVSDPEAPPHGRASLFIVPTDAAGYRLLRNTPVMGDTGGDLFSHGELEFEDCRVGAEALLGPRGEGFRLAQSRLGPGRIHHCMRWLGICERALAMMIERAAARVIGPDDRRLGDSDIVRVWIAESAAEIRAARCGCCTRLASACSREAACATTSRDPVSRALAQRFDRRPSGAGRSGCTTTRCCLVYREERTALIYAARTKCTYRGRNAPAGRAPR